MRKDYIKAVAIKVDDKVYQLPAPNRHHHVIRLIYEKTGKPMTSNNVQGFITYFDKFVDREEALVIAKAANQLLERHFHETELFSESVW